MKNYIKNLFNFYFKKYPEKEINVVIPSYNNAKWYKKNLDSVFNQKYKNYKIIYLDDASTDGTTELVAEYAKKQNKQDKITLIKNSLRVGATENRYTGSHMAPDDAIVIILDGDDWLANNSVFSYINKIYSSDDIWVTYGQFARWPSGEKGHCKKLSQDYNYRKMDQFYTSHLRTYYAWLFKKIEKQDLMYEDKFFQVAGDVAEMLPMLEMARNHIKFIPKVNYIYNQGTQFNDCKLKKNEQVYFFKYIKNKKSYIKLQNR